MTPILEVDGLTKHYDARKSLFGRGDKVRAVDNVSFSVQRGETLSIVGESGCGKSTVARTVLQLVKATGGKVIVDGLRIDNRRPAEIFSARRKMQIVFQDPYLSLNPRMKVSDIIAEPIRNFGLATSKSELRSSVLEVLEKVGLPSSAIERYPHEFSGGQRQRICVARALAAKPDLVICDEAVSALDVSVKAQIVNLLQDLQQEYGLALLFISHDLAIVEHLSHRVAVMYLGKIVECGSKASIFGTPQHPYTEALLSAVPVPMPGRSQRRIILKGDVPSPVHPPSGCRFHTRCPYAFDRCSIEEPDLRLRATGQMSACHLEHLPAIPAPLKAAD